MVAEKGMNWKPPKTVNLRRAWVLLAAVGMISLLAAPVFAQDAESPLARAAQLEMRGDHAGAEKIYRQVLLSSPDDPDLLKALGVVLQEQGKHEEAISVFQQILSRAPLYPGVNSQLAVSYYALNQFDKTVEVARRELTANPRDRQARYYLALALTAQGRTYEAIQQLESLAADDPRDLIVQYQLVVDYKAAMNAAAERLAKMAPDSEFTHAMRAEAFSDADRFDDAILEYQEVLRKNPGFPGIHLGLGQVYWKKKDSTHAMEQLSLALQEEPNQPLGNYYMGDMLVDEQKFQQAIPHLKITVAVYPELARARFLLGKAYRGTGDNQAALQEFQEALKLDPNYKEVHYQLYELYARLGDKEKSQEHLRISEKLTREGQEQDKARLQESLGKQKEADEKP